MTAHRIGLVSDIHANEVALSAILAAIKEIGVDQVACLGDIATLGPRPREVLEMLRERCDWFILGNHDEYMFEPDLINSHTRDAGVIDAVAWCRAELGSEDIAFLKRSAHQVNVPLGAAGSLLLFHGSPESNNVDLLAETPDAQLTEALGEYRSNVMAGGHTHVQMLRQHRGTLIVNPGSVGLPFERYVAGGPPTVLPHAEFAIVEATGRNVTVSLRRVGLDRAALVAAVRGWDSPLAGYLLEQYQRP